MAVTYYDRPFMDHGGQKFGVPVFGFDDETGKIKPGQLHDGARFVVIPFVRGHKDKDERQAGVLTEHVIGALVQRMEQLEAEFPSPEGEITLFHLRNALYAQQSRTVDRVRRGVLNQGKV
jgi:hypothetical protein